MAKVAATGADEPEDSTSGTLPAVPHSPPDPTSGSRYPTIPGYQIREVIGQGGMGIVYSAVDLLLGREAAIKMIRPGYGLDRLMVERFVVESRVTAQLPHPGVPAVYALGSLGDGQPYLAMKLIRGQTLASLLQRELPSEAARLVEVFAQVCHTVAFAHSRGIIHRDLKPHNVMVGAFGEVLVMDWGLAKASSSPSEGQGERALDGELFLRGIDTTMAGAVKGTPAYMAPEQARGEPVDARADVFALGGILAVILTGKPPFVGHNAMGTVVRAAQADLGETFARLDASGADPELIQVAKRCLAPRVEERYPDGGAVALAVAVYREQLEDRVRRAERDRTVGETIRAMERVASPVAQRTDAVDTVERFIDVVKALQILTPRQLAALTADLVPQFSDVRALADELVSRQWLTAFQREEILNGHWRKLALTGYTLVDKLGEGAFGIVYRAKQHLPSREVAIKVMRPDRTTDHVAVARFRREIDLASRLQHPNIASVYTAAEEGGRLYMVMELCSGDSLDAVLKRRSPLPCPEVRMWAVDAVNGLHHVHLKGLIHRDIKPANLLLTGTGVKVLDLGLARVVSTDASQSSANLTGNNVVGTANYMSPEQVNSADEIDIRSDLYNLGATLYHLIAGTPPFSGTAIQVAMAHVTKNPQPLAKRRADVPSGLAEVVHKLMEKEPADRYQTPAELLAALQAIPA